MKKMKCPLLEEYDKIMADAAVDFRAPGNMLRPSKQEALEIVMKDFGEYITDKGMRKLSKICALLGYTPAELGIDDVNFTFGDGIEDGHEDGAPHRYEIFLGSGASRLVTADEIIFDEEIDDGTGDVIKTIHFLRGGKIVAQMDRDTEFIICDEEKDNDYNTEN